MIHYSQINELCLSYFPDLSASQLAGILHGLVSHGFIPEEGRWQQQLAEFLNSGDPIAQDAIGELEQLLAFTQKDYQVDSFSIDLIIPEDDYPLSQRLSGLADWAQGFMTGYGLIKQKNKLEGDAEEAMQDLSQIAQLDPEAEDDEELEQAYMTICEHVKMSAQLIFMANQPEATPTKDQNQSVH